MKLRYLSEEETPNPEIHLGINGSPIDVKLFKGLWSEEGTIYGSDPYGDGVQIIIDKGEKTATIIGTVISTKLSNSYLLKEDIENFDQWYKISQSILRYELMTQVNSEWELKYEELKKEVLEEYYAGTEKDILSSSTVIFNDKGEYRNVDFSFFINRHDKPLHRLMDHQGIVSPTNYIATMKHEQKFTVEGKKEEILELQKLVNQASGIMMDNVDFVRIQTPMFGNLKFIENENLKRFIVRPGH